MKKSWAMKWVKALESGKFKQTRGQLYNKRGGGYCCLGVLCEITKKKYDKENWTLPWSIQKLVGANNDRGLIKYRSNGDEMSLVNYNDKSKMSFKEIAKIIRKYWKDL